MTGATERHYWSRYVDDEGAWRPNRHDTFGAELAALRRGINKEAGTIPAMWRFYTTLTADGRRTNSLIAEHLALTLYAVHQQSRANPMHRPGIGLGSAIRSLAASEKTSEPAVDKKFSAAATSAIADELGLHLRGLITRLRDIGQPLDYTLLFRDLRDWPNVDRQAAIRRRWGAQYFVHVKSDNPTA